ncbi:MAG: hypothetical protein ACYCQI_03040 [Gammaproteobacteria bacterium]
MTENLLHKLEEKVLTLLKELESLRNELTLQKLENSSLKSEKVNATKKLQGLVSLFDTPETENVVRMV